MVVTNGVAHAAAAVHETATAVLVLPVGNSVFRRLAEAAVREGVDVNSLALSLLMYGLGRQTVPGQRPASTVSTSNVGVVCMSCGRARQNTRESRCSTCRGSWTTAVR